MGGNHAARRVKSGLNPFWNLVSIHILLLIPVILLLAQKIAPFPTAPCYCACGASRTQPAHQPIGCWDVVLATVYVECIDRNIGMHMYMYMYVCMYRYRYMYMYMYLYMSIMCIYIIINIYLYTCVYIYVYIHVYIYIHIYIYIYIYTYTYSCVCLYLFIYINTLICVYVVLMPV
jgi:hypothetical protein